MKYSGLCQLLNIKYPIFQGGMAWISDADLAGAVSNAGGLGIIAAGNAPAEWLEEQVYKIKKITDKPFGINIMLMSPHKDAVAEAAAFLEVPVIITGAGTPGKYMDVWKSKGIKVFPVVPTTTLAIRMERSGADGLICEGTEAGGHIGELTTMTLVPQVVDAVSIPVIAAGGIADGRGFAAALMLGASGIQVGTRFLTAYECNVHQNYKNAILAARDTDAIVTGRSTGHPVRCLKNNLTSKFKKMEKSGISPLEIEKAGEGTLRKAALEGDVKSGSVMSGQIAGLVNKEESCEEIMTDLMRGMLQTIKNFNIEELS
ncbi:MAG: enoyl-[acyl-carrier-protein] reductase FabK [Tissierellales bacterium]|jgi:enoyl-[acyl-carrier protein] reductase II|nr:enoyl-[acyl-carrier-protein] reductase FabK [Tissierellales bacterium]MBN2826545.1 enoyl-[acyl-carrier-protein] reductase FabK [Tissierellales bacterium]